MIAAITRSGKGTVNCCTASPLLAAIMSPTSSAASLSMMLRQVSSAPFERRLDLFAEAAVLLAVGNNNKIGHHPYPGYSLAAGYPVCVA